MTKLVTAIGLLHLYERNFFTLDEDISIRLGFQVRNPNFPDIPITYRMLLSHTSSIQDSLDTVIYQKYVTNPSNPVPHLRELLTPNGTNYTLNLFLNKAPGTYFRYCNINSGIIATLIEKMANRRFD